ncbi:hypothetical protein NMG60_11013144 [Bertholletia excelsa]
MTLPTLPSAKSKSSPPNKVNSGILSMIRSIWYTILGAVLFVATTLFLKDTETPMQGPPSSGIKRWRIIKRTVSLDDAKLVKKVMNVTINDVAVGVTQAALSRYLNRRYGEQKSQQGSSEEKNHLSKSIRLRAIFLFNLRPLSGTQGLVDMMAKNSPVPWGNKSVLSSSLSPLGFERTP